MALFGRGDKAKGNARGGGASSNPAAEVIPLVGRKVFCGTCEAERTFTKAWKRSTHVRQCPCCGMRFENPRALYAQAQPACPKCGEFLEQPAFDYGFCDTCGSKYEILEGTKPGLLPNKAQRAEMDKHGKVWIPK